MFKEERERGGLSGKKRKIKPKINKNAMNKT